MSHFGLPISVCGLGSFVHFRSIPYVDVVPGFVLDTGGPIARPIIGFLYTTLGGSYVSPSIISSIMHLHNDQVHRQWLLRGGVLVWHCLSGDTGPCGVEPNLSIGVERPFMSTVPIVHFAFRYCEPSEFQGFGETVRQRIFRKRSQHESFGLERLGAEWLVGSLRSSYRLLFK